MLLAHHIGVQNTRRGIQGVNSGVDTQLCDTSGQDSGGVQVSECCSRGRICQVIGWHIDSLQKWEKNNSSAICNRQFLNTLGMGMIENIKLLNTRHKLIKMGASPNHQGASRYSLRYLIPMAVYHCTSTE